VDITQCLLFGHPTGETDGNYDPVSFEPVISLKLKQRHWMA